MASGTSSRLVSVINLGRMGFLQAYDVQLRYAHQHLDQLSGHSHAVGHNTLLLVEHNPVFTVGLRNKQYDEVEENRLKQVGAEFFRTNRGGLVTFHGPGQLVAYPILNLRQFQPSMKWYISALEKTIINTCSHFGIQAKTTDDTGVWVEDRKIAAIGVHGSRYITTHGISLNCNTDLTWFRHIIPCGIPGKEVTSISKELDKDTPVKTVIGHFLPAFEEEFDCKIEYSMLDSDDANLLRSEESTRGESMGSQMNVMPLQQGTRLMSTSASVAEQSKPRVSMW